MKKVLIISYFFPPCTLTAAGRTGSWAKYLAQFGYYPIIISRKWTGDENNEFDRLLTTPNKEVEIVKYNTHEIHYLPYKSSWRDSSFIKGRDNAFYKMLSRLLTFINLIFQNISLFAIPYSNFYSYSKVLIGRDKNINSLIISGNPFEQFYFGYLLKKQFSRLKWVADYRDEWTTSEINEFGYIRHKINFFQSFFEKKWLKNASLIMANTRYASQKLKKFHAKKTEQLINGYDFEINELKLEKDFKSLKIVHNGTLYPTQKLEIFQKALLQVEIPENFKLIIEFPGIKYDKKVSKYAEDLLKDVPAQLSFTERIPKEDVLEKQLSADILLMVAHKGKKGIVGSKLYEYIGLQKPILLCPTDEDELEETIRETGLGFIISNEKELIYILQKCIQQKIEHGKIVTTTSQQSITKFARIEQVRRLSLLLDDL